jgi:hypothetical protein
MSHRVLQISGRRFCGICCVVNCCNTRIRRSQSRQNGSRLTEQPRVQAPATAASPQIILQRTSQPASSTGPAMHRFLRPVWTQKPPKNGAISGAEVPGLVPYLKVRNARAKVNARHARPFRKLAVTQRAVSDSQRCSGFAPASAGHCNRLRRIPPSRCRQRCEKSGP